MPKVLAVFQATVIDMSKAGASGESGCEKDVQSTQSVVPTILFVERGEVEKEWTPPAITALSMPAMMEAAPVCTAANPAAQCRFWASPGTFSRPASTAT